MKLMARKGSISIFQTDPPERNMIIFVGEKRFEITGEQFDKIAVVNVNGTLEDFVKCLMDAGIMIDKDKLT